MFRARKDLQYVDRNLPHRQQGIITTLHPFNHAPYRKSSRLQGCLSRVGVGIARIRCVCDLVRVASRHGPQRGPLIAPQKKTPAVGPYGDPLASRCRIRANPVRLRVSASRESPSEVFLGWINKLHRQVPRVLLGLVKF